MRAIAPLFVAAQAGTPVLAIGSPGVGKSAIINSVGNSLDYEVFTVIASLREPADFAGLPFIKDGKVFLAPPAWAVAAAESKRAIVFLDEISTASPATQAALLRPVLERVVGDIVLPSTVSFIAAMNPPDEAAGGWDLSAPLANRFCHLNWIPDAAIWIDGMMQGFPVPSVPRLPANWESYLLEARTMVSSFIRHKQTLFLNVPKEADKMGKPWPSPRSWTMAATLQAATKAAQAGRECEALLVAGCVGEGSALEYLSWRDAMDLPNPEDVLADPDNFEVPDRGDKLYTVLASVAVAVATNLTKDRYLRAYRVFNRAAEAGKKDVAAASVRMLSIAGVKAQYLTDEKLRRAVQPLMKPFVQLLTEAGII